MSIPLVSIIIPTYNRAHLIGETLDSVMAQTYTNWECIVVDDGSTDDTDKLLNEYCKRDGRIQYHHRPYNRPKGANACRNYGFELSKGEFINWFDSDDLMSEDKLGIQVRLLNNSIYNFIVCQTMVFDTFKNQYRGLLAPALKSDNVFEDYILSKVFWLTNAPLWKKEFLINHDLKFDEDLQQSQDYDFHMRVLSISENYLIVDKALVVFNSHEENMSNTAFANKKKIYSNAKVKDNILFLYRRYLSLSTLAIKYNEQYYFFKYCLRNNQFKNALFLLKSLIRNISVINVSKMSSFLIIVKFCLALISFRIFNRGEVLLNKKIAS